MNVGATQALPAPRHGDVPVSRIQAKIPPLLTPGMFAIVTTVNVVGMRISTRGVISCGPGSALDPRQDRGNNRAAGRRSAAHVGVEHVERRQQQSSAIKSGWR